MKLVDVRTFNVVKTFEDDSFYNGQDYNTASLSHKATYAAAGSKNGNLVIFDINSGEVEEVYSKEHTTSIVGCAW